MSQFDRRAGQCSSSVCDDGFGLTPKFERYRAALDERQRRIIEQSVARVFGVAPPDLGASTRGRAQVALARQVAMYIDHVTCGHSFTEVGVLFERDRTTVAHACSRIEDRRDDPTFDRVLELLEWAVPSLLRPRMPVDLAEK